MIFKSDLADEKFAGNLSFTFQSGDIQICNCSKEQNIIIQFTFQSGDIQIELACCKCCSGQKFTFQSGDIQIKP